LTRPVIAAIYTLSLHDALPISHIDGVYTQQVRSFDIDDDGVNLSLANIATSTPDADYRRRDLNIFPVMRPASGSSEPGLIVLSGDRKSTRLNSSHVKISYAVFC